ncbi:type I methionyl aminopeptidase [bacterium]|nr:type I methionyl aminopeptidase [bacterium]
MIRIRNSEEIELLRESGRLVAESLALAGKLVRPGITTVELDAEIEKFIRSNEGSPEFKGYNGFPAAACISINEEVVHGIPGPRELKDGDIVGVDVGVRKRGYVGDGARTFVVGDVPEGTHHLINATREALKAGLAVARAGVHLSDVSHAIQVSAESCGYSVVRDLAGHGVGTKLHEEPEVPNFGPPGIGPVLKSGMVLAIEPMVNAGTVAVRTLGDGWTVVTADGALSAHFEHTVAVTRDGVDILTLV